MKNKLIVCLPLMVSITSCRGASSKPILLPSGAPTVAFYNHIDQFETLSNVKGVLDNLLTNNYDMVVVDFYNGLKNIKNNNGNFKLARILTAGNLVLVGINKDVEPSEGDYVVSFGRGALPDLAFKEIYRQNYEIDYVDGVSYIAPIMKSGLYNGRSVDYVLIAEPLLTATLQEVEDRSIYTTFSIREAWEEIKGEGHIIPQAGLFINNDRYNSNPNKYNEFIAILDNEIANALDNPMLVKTALESVGDTLTQKDKFGIPGAMAYRTLVNGNGLGLVRDYSKNMINDFLDDLGVEEDYSDYIL